MARRAIFWQAALVPLMAACSDLDSASPDVAGSGERMGESEQSSSSEAAQVATDCVADLGCELDPLPTTGDPARDCADRINQFRTLCACLPPLQRWTEGEACADEQAAYDSSRSPHAGFRDDLCDGGSAQNECPGWPSVDRVVADCLQAMWDEGPAPGEPCDGACFQQHGHFINMSDERYSAVACGFFETGEGEVWSVQNFTR